MATVTLNNGVEMPHSDSVSSRRRRMKPATRWWLHSVVATATLHGFEKECRQTRCRPDRRADPPPGPALHVRPDLEAYRALETLLADGRVRSIGVSNFMVEHMTKLLDAAMVVAPSTRSSATRSSPSGRCSW